MRRCCIVFGTTLSTWDVNITKLFPNSTTYKPPPVLFSTLAARSNHSPAFSNLDPLDHPHLSLFCDHDSILKITNRSFWMPHLTCRTSFLLLFVFFISSILHPALFCLYALILDRTTGNSRFKTAKFPPRSKNIPDNARY